MTYMSKGPQKNFTLPAALRKRWDKFKGTGSKEDSKNAAGALFLFMLMPADVRELCRKAAYKSRQKTAIDNFWLAFRATNKEAALARTLLETSRSLEEDSGKKRDDISAKSG